MPHVRLLRRYSDAPRLPISARQPHSLLLHPWRQNACAKDRGPAGSLVIMTFQESARNMTCSANNPKKMLVVIASYGTANDRYLVRVLDEYRSMPYTTDIIVLSNVAKDLGPDVTVNVGLPNKNSWSLPFGHKQIFADRLENYDLFVYSEDDVLITSRNIEAFQRVSAVLPEDEIPGFLRFEKAPDGSLSYPDVHSGYHWDVQRVRSRGNYICAFFTNEHAASYLLTQRQLRRAIDSGGFLVGPHEGKYDLLCSAATDPYTQCGLVKMICISHIADFLIHHLPNKYVGKLGLAAMQFDAQIQELLKIAQTGKEPSPMLSGHPGFQATSFAKDYYEPIRSDLIDLVPPTTCTVLSIGCGWGATEEHLAQRGKRVLAVALDPVISACARSRGVKIVEGDLRTALDKLSGEKFDCILLPNVLHLIHDPRTLLRSLEPLMQPTTVVITTVPNLARIPVRWRTCFGNDSHRSLGNFAKSGVHFTSHRRIRNWLRSAGLKVDRFADVVPARMKTLCDASGGVLAPLLSSEIVAVAAPS